MKFSIEFTEPRESNSEENLQLAIGEIRIEDFIETFQSSLSYWDKNIYVKQWQEALWRTVNGNYSSCLITSMYDPSYANFIIWWLIYRENDDLFIQNQLLFLENLTATFREDQPYIHIPQRITINEDGVKISEWKTSVKSLVDFLQHSSTQK